ncbi:hypothetical protein ACFVIM_08310 [Streptomyces sp. NPDC057638]|uniref:hypothetical protein n=1 Tax=Streptomyces sp. NPDC057638 TaxID=3346190 RepID=UPI0036B6AB9A
MTVDMVQIGARQELGSMTGQLSGVTAGAEPRRADTFGTVRHLPGRRVPSGLPGPPS